MKKILSICLLIAGLVQSANAQFTDGKAATKAVQESFAEEYKDWDEIKVAIEKNAFRMPDIEFADGETYENIPVSTSIAVSYLHNFALNKKVPVFLNTGFGIKWGMYDNHIERKIYEYTGIAREKLNLFTFEIPVNIGYRFDMNNPNWKFFPYTGLYLRMHIAGKLEAENASGYKDEANIFDEDEFYPTFERFQCGWQLGLDFQYRKFMFGWSCGIDLNKIWIDTRVFTSTLNIGYRF